MEKYILEKSPVTNDETMLTIAPLDSQGFESRGVLLAKALRGRYATTERHLFMTPARAGKWILLFKAGFSAEKTPKGWMFIRPGFRCRFPLHDAIRVAHALTRTNELMEAVA